MTILDHLPASLVEAAIVNQPEGCEQIAWRRADALGVLRELAPTGVAVLGGDVLVCGVRGFHHALDNWSCDHQAGEAWPDYAARSRHEAEAYISRYPERGEEVAYVLVLQEEPSARDLLLSRDVDAGA